MRKLLLLPLLAIGTLAARDAAAQEPAPAPAGTAPLLIIPIPPIPHQKAAGTYVPPPPTNPTPAPAPAPPTTSNEPACASATATVAESALPPDTDPWALFAEGPFRVGGWVDGGGVWNAGSPESRYNGPFNATDRDDFVANQVYVFLEKRLSGQGFDVGGRLDVLYGNDYLLPQSYGLERRPDRTGHWSGNGDYGLAVPQAYAEAGFGPASVRVGHFYAPTGYESVMSAYNFFYTHSYSYQFGQPFTLWGAQARLDLGAVVLEGGVANGWNGFDREQDSVTGFGAVGFRSSDNRFGLTYALILGQEPTDFNALDSFATQCRMSLLGRYQLTQNLEHVVLCDMTWQDHRQANGATGWWYGVTDYWYYRVCETVRLGLRGEWFRDEDGTRVLGTRRLNPNNAGYAGNFYEVTLGLNWTPSPNVLIRPECRWDWFERTGRAGPRPFDDGNDNGQFLFACDFILRF